MEPAKGCFVVLPDLVFVQQVRGVLDNPINHRMVDRHVAADLDPECQEESTDVIFNNADGLLREAS